MAPTSSKSARYLIGIDLGTTNSVLAYCDNQQPLNQSEVKIFDIDQLVGPGEVVRKPLLPSFRFHPAGNHFSTNDLTLPWSNHSHIKPIDGELKQVIIGHWARELGSQIEGRQISSAKSWLSHDGVDRQSDTLPWGSSAEVEKVSPVIASASYLNHMRQSWNYHHPDAPLEAQHIVITIPASFDETARKLTLQAAQLAGLNDIHLLEEPQAVCYDWYHRHHAQAQQQLADIPQILVCDVGGGTTDLSLITANSQAEKLELNRIGVGNHLMLGGDNIDLALAHLAEQRLNQNQRLKASALMKLIQQTRSVKENLLSAKAPDSAKISLLGSGSRLIGGTKSVPISRDEIHQLVLEGFFPLSDYQTRPKQRQAAVVEFGLPYVTDPAISHHIAEFLQRHQDDSQTPSVPTGLLLNGGVFNSPLVRERLVQLLSNWHGSPITLLDNPHPDLAVAFGAVAYAKALQGSGMKIGGGSARSYFLHLKQNNKTSQALCLLAKGSQEGEEIRLTGRQFLLTLGEPIKIDILTSTQEHFINAQGDSVIPQNSLLVNVNRNIDKADFKPLPPYVATLDSQTDRSQLHANQKDRVEVMLACQLTEVGTLKMECVSREDDRQRWSLEFDVRAEHQQHNADIHPRLIHAIDLITGAYSANKATPHSNHIKTLSKDLDKQLGKRDEWDFVTLRPLFDALLSGRKRRRRSADHEKQWLRLAGFTLRPGFGDAGDSWRCEQIWPLYQQGIQFHSHQSWSDWWVMWRRICGGLNQDQQEALLADMAKYLHPGAHRNKASAKQANDMGYEAMVRLVASLEHLDVEDKTLLTTWLLNRAQSSNEHVQAHWWAVGRLASRCQMYGSQHNVIPASQVVPWLQQMLPLDWKAEPMIAFAAVMMCRKTGDRSLDIANDVVAQVKDKLQQARVPALWLELISEIKSLSQAETKRVFGDSLPVGLQLI